MKKVARTELLDLQTYERKRAAIRKQVMKAKARRRSGRGNQSSVSCVGTQRPAC